MRILVNLCICLLIVCVAHAQQPSVPATSRLRQMEEIYQKELSMRHIPLLGKYLVELQRLSATAANKTPYQKEITRIQQIISEGGVVDLIAAQQTQSGEAPIPTPMPAPVPGERRQATISLTPAIAQGVAPASAVNNPASALSGAQWRVEFIGAGTYDLVLHYSCPELVRPLPVKIEFGGQVVEKILETRRATKDAKTFRIFRIGSLTLTDDLRGETLRFSAGDKAAPQLILKSLLITKPRPAS